MDSKKPSKFWDIFTKTIWIIAVIVFVLIVAFDMGVLYKWLYYSK